MTDPAKVVTAFIAAVEAKDVGAAVELLADDVRYENVPMSPIVGKEAVRAALDAFLEPTLRVEWPITRQIIDGNVVINERRDRFEFANGWLEMPVVGIFEVTEHGTISLWRDYFDLATYTDQRAALGF